MQMGFALSEMKLASSAFQDRGSIPKNYTGEGEDVSPALSWSNIPEGTKSFALFCHDPDAPLVTPGNYGFVHWVLYNVPASVTQLHALEDRATHDVARRELRGLVERRHEAHPGSIAKDVEPNVIGMNRLVGTYSRG
jgi:Raf kinase inhibitor-like YbhB/YbcL family protein